MHPRTKSRLLWGVVGLLSFLVLIQGYELVTDNLVDWGLKLAVAVVVGVAAAVVTGESQARLIEDGPSHVDDTGDERS
jgi:hypothetical protein